MSALKEQWELFAWGIAQGQTEEQAYRGAGYKPKSSEAARSSASALITNPNIRARIEELRPKAREALQQRFADRAIAAFRVLDEIASDPNQPPPQRVSAAKHILGLAGYSPVEKVETDINLKSWYQRILHDEREEVTDDRGTTRNKGTRAQGPARDHQ